MSEKEALGCVPTTVLAIANVLMLKCCALYWNNYDINYTMIIFRCNAILYTRCNIDGMHIDYRNQNAFNIIINVNNNVCLLWSSTLGPVVEKLKRLNVHTASRISGF